MTKLKLLHNLYKKGDLKICDDGLVMVKGHSPNRQDWAISIPYKLFPGLMQALHFKFVHPSKQQLAQLVSRHFYCPGFQDIINTISDNCHQCNSLKILPKILLQESTQPLICFGSSLAVDVMERQSQKILVMVEQLSNFTWTALIPDQTATTLMETMISMAASFTREQPSGLTMLKLLSASPLKQLPHNQSSLSSIGRWILVEFIIPTKIPWQRSRLKSWRKRC